jgi:hypothetical protein
MSWQPIDTAPKDGTFVLVRGFDTNTYEWETDEYPPAVVAHWRSDEYSYEDDDGVEREAGDWYYAYWDGSWRSAVENPTEWSPLP